MMTGLPAVSRCTLLAERARGRQAVLYDARGASGEALVVKRLLAAEGDDLGRTRLAREARLGQTLRHPGLAQVVDAGEDWIAFEAIDAAGHDLRARRAGFAGDPTPLLAALARILAYLHARGVVHRDVKPAHVRFREDGAPVLLDLGIAGLLAGDPLDRREVVGSPAWMAPEQTAGAPASSAADTWSLCALGAWLLTGLEPFAGSADAVLARRRAGEEPAWLPFLREGPAAAHPLAPRLRAGLSLEPTDRPGLSAFIAA